MPDISWHFGNRYNVTVGKGRLLDIGKKEPGLILEIVKELESQTMQLA